MDDFVCGCFSVQGSLEDLVGMPCCGSPLVGAFLCKPAEGLAGGPVDVFNLMCCFYGSEWHNEHGTRRCDTPGCVMCGDGFGCRNHRCKYQVT